MPHPLDDDQDTRTRLALLEQQVEHVHDDLERINLKLDPLVSFTAEWWGRRGEGDLGLRGRVLNMLEERSAARIGVKFVTWALALIGSAVGAFLGIRGIFHS